MAVKDEISAKQLMEELVARSALTFVQSLKEGNKGNENQILRDVKMINGYTETQDLPEHLQKTLNELVDSMFKYINGKGYKLVPKEDRKK